MARRPGRDDDNDPDETPPWMEARAPRPSRTPPARDFAEPAHTLISWRALIIGAAIALIAAIGLVIGVRRMSTPDAATLAAANGEVPLIRAPATPYKSRIGGDAANTAAPAAPGVDPGAANDPIGALAAGQDAPVVAITAVAPAAPPPRAPTDLMPTNGPVDATADAPAAADLAAHPVQARPAPAPAPAPMAVTEKPVVAPNPKPKPKPKLKPAEPAFELPAADAVPAKPHRGSQALQLGAFSTREKAVAAWENAAATHPELARLLHRIDPIEREGRTLYRLRATGASAAKLCATLSGAACVTQ